MYGITDSSSSSPPSVTPVAAQSSQLGPPSSSASLGSREIPPRRDDDTQQDASEAVGSGPSDDEVLSDASPQPLSRGKRLDRHHFVKTHALSTGQKRLHPPHHNGESQGDGCRCDPSRVIPTEMLFRCTSYLDPQSLLQLQLTSRFYLDLARQNEAGWDGLCRGLWRDKATIAFRDGAGNELPRYEPPDNWMRAYFSSIADAKRSFLTVEDLVFDPPDGTVPGRLHDHDADSPASILCRLRRAQNVWSFRFKASAGSDWTAQDPWYSGEPCRKLVFMRDGSILQYVSVPPADTTKKDAQSGVDRRVIGSSSAAESCGCPSVLTSYQLTEPPFPMRWRFLSNHPLDLPNRPFGSYVRMSVGGREVPTYSVFRCESNWGFAMESCWGLYANFELPPRQRQPPPGSLAGRQPDAAVAVSPRLPEQIRQRRRLRRTEDGGALWVNNEDDDDNDNENEGQARGQAHGERAGRHFSHPSFLRLQDDASLFITNEVQWREAFLYNSGAFVLPEGDEATTYFDRAWQGIT